MGFTDGGFGFLHFTDGFRDITFSELLSGVLRGFSGGLEVGVRLALLGLLLLHFAEGLREFFLLLLKLLGEAGGVL